VQALPSGRALVADERPLPSGGIPPKRGDAGKVVHSMDPRCIDERLLGLGKRLVIALACRGEHPRRGE